MLTTDRIFCILHGSRTFLQEISHADLANILQANGESWLTKGAGGKGWCKRNFEETGGGREG